VIVSVNGVPSFELVPLDENDNLIDQLIAHNPRFGALLRARLKENAVSVREAAKQI
jgi:hypothetical protein